MGWNIVMSTISVWKNGLYRVSLKWIWQFFIFIFQQPAKRKRGKEDRKHSILATFFFFTSMISKRKGKALISLIVHDSRNEGGLSPFGKSWTARVFILLMAFGNDFTAQIVMRLLQCKWDTSEIFYLKTPNHRPLISLEILLFNRFWITLYAHNNELYLLLSGIHLVLGLE